MLEFTSPGRRPLVRMALVAGALAGTFGQTAAQEFGPKQKITAGIKSAQDVYAADLDGDGDEDVLSASREGDEIAWHENLGAGVFGPQQVLGADVDGAFCVRAADLDGDGDTDVLSASHDDDSVAWYENLGGGAFAPKQLLSSSADGARAIRAVDLDGDGDMDVVSASYNDNKIAWYENAGSGLFRPEQVIATDAFGANSVHTPDLDGDGDADILSTSAVDDEIAWYENLGGGSFGPQQVIEETGWDDLAWAEPVDLDGDGHLDILYTDLSHVGGSGMTLSEILWKKNLGSDPLSFGADISIEKWGEPLAVRGVDLDADGTQDVLRASWAGEQLAWHENFGGGLFLDKKVISTDASAVESLHTTDLDQDGDLDVLSASSYLDGIAWYSNLLGPFDCDQNGVPDHDDIAAGTSQDCNANGIPDGCDITSGTSKDIDANGIPDECVAPALVASPAALSLTVGGTQNFTLSAGPPPASNAYLLLGSLGGTDPGVPAGGHVLPLNPDAYFLYTLQNANGGVLVNSFGALLPDGSAGAPVALHLPAGLSFGLIGATLHHAYAVFDLAAAPGESVVASVSNAVSLKLVP